MTQVDAYTAAWWHEATFRARVVALALVRCADALDAHDAWLPGIHGPRHAGERLEARIIAAREMVVESLKATIGPFARGGGDADALRTWASEWTAWADQVETWACDD